MLRFGTPTTNRRKPTTSRERWRLWMLFVAACAVLWCMRMLQQPEVSRRIDAVFTPTLGPNALASGDETIDVESVSPEASHSGPSQGSGIAFQGNALVSRAKDPSSTQFDLSAVKDNTYFRAEENPAWFAVWEYVRQATVSELAANSLGEATYAQLIDQPDVYRGQVVSVRGTAMRMESLEAPANEIGLETYRRLIIRPAGGGVWPMVVYCLELPPKFPSSEEPRADIEVTGVFFKNWSYSWQGGLGLAPVVLANTFAWQPPAVVERPQAHVSPREVLIVVAAAGALATVAGWLAWRQTRRPLTPTGGHDVVIAPPAERKQGTGPIFADLSSPRERET